MNEIVHLATHELAAAIRARRISAIEAVEAHLDRIGLLNPHLNAVVTLDEEGARRCARLADHAISRGEVCGPLHGVPFTLKDCHATQGMRTTAGFPPLGDHVPQEDGTVAARLKAAGAILIGKSNVPPLAMSLRTENPIFGRTSNPWDLDRSPGGSSGGAAAAVAAGLVSFDIGSDLTGSVRIPAHYCGVFGLKPTANRLPVTGHIPPIPGTPRVDRHIAVVGPIARCVEDLALLCSCLAGPDGQDLEVPPVTWRKTARREIRDLRIAFLPSFPDVPTSRAVVAAVERATMRLSEAGALMVERGPGASIEEIFALWRAYFPLLAATMTELSGAETAERKSPALADWTRVHDRRDRLIRSVDALFSEFDAFLCPAVISTAFPHGTPVGKLPVDGQMVDSRYVDHYLLPFNLTGHPSVVIPAGLAADDGLPVGIQLVGGRWEDEVLLATAAAVSEVMGGFVAPPVRSPRPSAASVNSRQARTPGG
jgi:amidase